MPEIKYKASFNCPAGQAYEGLILRTIESFLGYADPAKLQVRDMYLAAKEAVANAVDFAYPWEVGQVYVTMRIYTDDSITIIVKDTGIGLDDVEKCRRPLYTTDEETHSGMGFTIMESMVTKLRVYSKKDKGTTVSLQMVP